MINISVIIPCGWRFARLVNHQVTGYFIEPTAGNIIEKLNLLI